MTSLRPGVRHQTLPALACLLAGAIVLPVLHNLDHDHAHTHGATPIAEEHGGTAHVQAHAHPGHGHERHEDGHHHAHVQHRTRSQPPHGHAHDAHEPPHAKAPAPSASGPERRGENRQPEPPPADHGQGSLAHYDVATTAAFAFLPPSAPPDVAHAAPAAVALAPDTVPPYGHDRPRGPPLPPSA